MFILDPCESPGHAYDPHDARRISALMGRQSYDAGVSNFAGGSLGIGAPNVVNENEAAALLPGEEDAVDHMVGISDSKQWYTSSVEMVTCPDTYPIWRTRRPVIIVLTDDEKYEDSMDDGDGSSSSVYNHHYRYLVVTPGAENEGSHGLATPFDSDSDMDSISHSLNKTKISTGSLSNLGLDVMTSGDGGEPHFPVTLWEHPFLSSDEDLTAALSREFSIASRSNSGGVLATSQSGGAMSLYSEAATSIMKFGEHAREYDLASLPYRTLDIDVATASVIKTQASMDEDSTPPKYTEDGILIDNWNGVGDITYRPYRIREEKRAPKDDDTDMVSSASGDSSAMVMEKSDDKPRQRIFIVCYHLPVIVSKNEKGEWQACWAESLLSKTENSSFVSSSDPHWVGTVTTNTPIVDDADKQALQSLLASMDCTALFIDDAVRDAHYKGFCKQVLWLAFHHIDLLDMHDPAFSMDLEATNAEKQKEGTLFDLHSMWDQRQVGQWFEAYNIVNSTFAKEVAKMVKPDDVVWVHDYHLSLLPQFLGEEEKRLNAPKLTKKIFYLHIPFPVSMIFKEIECGVNILEGILHADVVGFHGYTDTRHFLSSAKRVLGLSQESLEGGLIGVRYKKKLRILTMSQVSIEPYMVTAAMQLQTTIDGEAALRSKHAGRIIIAGLDVAQYLSGVGLKLSIYEKILDDAPDMRGKLVLVQRCLITGARKLDETRTIRQIRAQVNIIKSKHGEAVIDYDEVFGSTLPVDQRLALWKASDILLNTEVRGEFQLWPLEFVYAQKGLDNPGCVIASEFSAVFSILNGAFRINPYDMKRTLSTIDKALTMSNVEREGRFLRDIDFIASSSSAEWIQNVLRDLQDQVFDEMRNQRKQENISPEVQNVSEFLSSERDEQFTRLCPKSILSSYKSSSRRVIILDFNGTIVLKEAVDSFLKRDAVGATGNAPPHAVCQSLERLCADPQNTVFVVSGDIHENVEKAIGHIPGLGLAASNGSFFSPPDDTGGARTWLALDLGVNWETVKQVAIPIMSKFTVRTNGSFIKIAHSSIGWSFFDCDPELGSLMAKYLVIELENALATYDVRFVNLKGIVEVIPRKLNKGIIVKKILRDVGARNDNAGVDFILCMGDDVSDEKMFTSVFSYLSEIDDDYVNVTPSPPVVQLTPGTVPAAMPFLVEPASARCRGLDVMHTYTVSVGKKATHASQYVDSAEDVADLLVKMAAGSSDAVYHREGQGERQLMQFS